MSEIAMDPYLAIKTNADYLAYSSLVALLKDYSLRISSFGEIGSKDAIDQVVREIALPTTTDLIAIHDLIGRGYSSSAETLLRTQIERIATLSFLRKNPTKVEKWAKNGEVGSLPLRIDSMEDLRSPLTGQLWLEKSVFQSGLKEYAKALNALVHCNRAGAYNGQFELEGDTFVVAGSNPYAEKLSKRVCNYAGQVLCYLVQELNIQYPILKEYYLGKAA